MHAGSPHDPTGRSTKAPCTAIRRHRRPQP